MIHQYKLNGYNIVLDTCSGGIHVVDDVAYDIISLFESKSRDEVIDTVSNAYLGKNGITKEDIENYNKECNLTKAKNRVMDIINRRLLPKKAIIDDLIKRGFDKQIATEAVKEFENLGYIDDYFFATEYAKDAFFYKKHGKLRIINDLCQKGIEKDIAKDALDELELDEKDNLIDILKSRFANTDFSDFKEKNKVIRYFATRGYNISDIINAIDKLK